MLQVSETVKGTVDSIETFHDGGFFLVRRVVALLQQVQLDGIARQYLLLPLYTLPFLARTTSNFLHSAVVEPRHRLTADHVVLLVESQPVV